MVTNRLKKNYKHKDCYILDMFHSVAIIILSDAQIVPLDQLLYICATTLSVFENSFLFLFKKTFRTHFIHFLVQNSNMPFLQRALVFLNEKWYFETTSGICCCKSAHDFRVVFSFLPFEWIELENRLFKRKKS